MKLLVRATAILAALVVVYSLWLGLRIWQQSRTDEVRYADAIVVLGAAQYNGRPSPVFQARLDHAEYLYEEDLGEIVIVTGGKQAGDQFSEAEAGASYLESQGIPAEVIMTETEGRTTLESLRNVADMTEGTTVDSVLLVSDPMHSERIKTIASDLGFDPAYASWASYQQLPRTRETKFEELVHEIAALAAYEILGR
ncbi:MAG: YdcF family protein [Actinomycetota bacterium]